MRITRQSSIPHISTWWRSRPRLLLGCTTVLALLPGCTTHPDEAMTADAVAADWIHPACIATALQPPRNNACNGPWSFNYIEQYTCEDTTQACARFFSC